jgi:hypothetical protein
VTKCILGHADRMVRTTMLGSSNLIQFANEFWLSRNNLKCQNNFKCGGDKFALKNVVKYLLIIINSNNLGVIIFSR